MSHPLIPYLPGNERVTAALMDTLYAELDRKMTLMLSGKSFFLGQAAAMPQRFCGKCFFFTSGNAVYANKAPGWQASSGTLTIPYDHDIFTNAVNAIDPATVTWDETNKIAHVPSFPPSAYGTVPQHLDGFNKPLGAGLLDWSLQTHYLMHQGASDSEPVPYYIWEDSGETGGGGALPSLAPEKHYKFTVAEIILEGQTSVLIPPAWDKYSCFRIHNLNNQGATVFFFAGTTINLLPLQCITVRRDYPNRNYRTGYNYFWKFEPGDPRFYWFMPKGNATVDVDDAGVSVTNSMAVNNLTNPAILFDWVSFFERDLGFTVARYDQPLSNLTANNEYCGWQLDPSIQTSVYNHYTSLFGDPGNPTTLLGDVIHHRGPFLIVRSSKTLTDPITGKPLLTFETGHFNGYATIVGDFATYQLGVTTNGSGDLVISSTDPDNDVILVPYGTNLFKRGDTRPTAVSLVGSDTFTIENAIFENAGDPTNLVATATQSIFQPIDSTAPTSESYFSWDAGTKQYDTSNTVTGTPRDTLNWNNPAGSPLTIHGIHAVTVGTLLNLDYFGDPSVPGQNGPWVSISNRQLWITPQGLVVTFTETDSGAKSSGSPNLSSGRGMPQNKAVTMRGHGFGYVGANGSRDSGWFSCRDARRTFINAYTYEIYGPNGTDFTLSEDDGQTGVPLLGRYVVDLLRSGANGRFFSFTTNDYLVKLMSNYSTLSESAFGALWALSDVAGMNNGSAPVVTGDTPTLAMTLLPEMYNSMAQQVNAITKASPLNYRCLRWNIYGQIVGVDSWIEQSTINQLLNHVSIIQRGNWDASANSPPLASGMGTPGDFYIVTTAGTTMLDGISAWAAGDYVYFTSDGIWTKPGSSPDPFPAFYDWADALGPVPIDLFAAFDPNSQFEAWCKVTGVPILDTSDFPGGFVDTGGGPGGADFATITSKVVCPAITWQTQFLYVSGYSFSGSGPTWTESATITGVITNEILNMTDLLNGAPTGINCLGNWSDANCSIIVDDSNRGKYWVVGSSFTSACLGAVSKGDIVYLDQNGLNLLRLSNLTNIQTGVTNAGLNLTNTNLGTFRWVSIGGIQAYIESLGFAFAFWEMFTPMSLQYFEDNTQQSVITSSNIGPTAASITVSSPPPASLNGLALLAFGQDANLGRIIKFCVDPNPGRAFYKNVAMGQNFVYAWSVYELADANSPIQYGMIGSFSWTGGDPAFPAIVGGLHAFGANASQVTSTSVAYDFAYSMVNYSPISPAQSDYMFAPVNANISGIEQPNGYSFSAINRQRHVLVINVAVTTGTPVFVTTAALAGDELYYVTPNTWGDNISDMATFFDTVDRTTTGYVVSSAFPISYANDTSVTEYPIGRGLNLITPPSQNSNWYLLLQVVNPLIDMQA